MLRVRVCAAHMSGVLDPKSSKQGSFFGRFSSNIGGFSRNWLKIVKMGSFPPKFIIKVGMIATVGVQKRVAFWKPGGRPPYIRKSCTPPGEFVSM